MSLQIEKNTAYSAIVTLAVAKNYLKQEYGTDATEDTLINSLIQQAHEFLERRLNKSLSASTTWTVWTDEEEDFVEFDLPCSPHASITTVKGIDNEGTKTALTLNSGYWVKGNQQKVLTFGSLNSGGAPGSGITSYVALEIIFVAGYTSDGVDAEFLPEAIVDAILMIVAESYVNRGDGDASLSLPARALQIADAYKDTWI